VLAITAIGGEGVREGVDAVVFAMVGGFWAVGWGIWGMTYGMVSGIAYGTIYSVLGLGSLLISGVGLVFRILLGVILWPLGAAIGFELESAFSIIFGIPNLLQTLLTALIVQPSSLFYSLMITGPSTVTCEFISLLTDLLLNQLLLRFCSIFSFLSDFFWFDSLWTVLCVTMCITGTALMTAADCQKYWLLKCYYHGEEAFGCEKPKESGKEAADDSSDVVLEDTFVVVDGDTKLRRVDSEKPATSKPPHKKSFLINNSIWATCRNPNYLGEMLIYFSFALMSKNCVVAYAIVVTSWVGLFLPNMMLKDESLRRKNGWEEYEKASGLFWFKDCFCGWRKELEGWME
jgi:hypothetical protein